jgi:cytochrome c-type biogenesis protein CcmE|tara:strand:- start:1808 stop:2248 length:441 start_codon:yes stop_codon:yes gene_type:complete
MSVRFQRLLIILLSLIFISISIGLILINSKNNLIFFFTPTELINSNTKVNDKIRIGGIIKKKSIISLDNNKYNFIVMDNYNSIEVTYSGLLPDLFKEGQGAVIEGKLLKNNLVEAFTVFAKHDENYMPKSIKQQLEKNEYWKKNYR